MRGRVARAYIGSGHLLIMYPSPEGRMQLGWVIDKGTFGVCDDCGEKISVKRLEARPETTLCIRCKEDQERVEKDFT